ncbi:MAG TPA: NB-ARC domain-containing protein [Ktedonobacteraceae bacterium]|nr:NB-ARC domain-containing protein [Ktedonobacteraceae bacterium]
MATREGAQRSTHLSLFREKVNSARRRAGRLQKELAGALGIDAEVLSRKLHGQQNTFPTHREVKQIVKELAAWDAITTQSEAIELLSLMGLKRESFSEEEWNSAPLNRLESVPQDNRASSIAPSPSPVQLANLPLPVPSTSFIGRMHDVELLLDRLRQPSVRLLTLFGTGGVGKTRLALEVAHAVQQEFAGGAFFVYLATISDIALVPSTIAQALRLAEPIAGGDSGRQSTASHTDMLKNFLREKECLLVLDNVEQIPNIGLFIGDLLGAAARLKIIATSRAVLHLYGEYEFDVPPLEVCTPGQAVDIDYLSHLPATRLFVERAQAVNSAFQITENNAAMIADICARLDGLPLAIELAAARTKVLSLPAIWQRLVDSRGGRLAFLHATTYNTLQRHQTLQETLDWSYDLLNERQQRLFRRLAVFLGGWSLHAALAIAVSDNEKTTLDDALLQMEALIDHSIVKRALPESMASPLASPDQFAEIFEEANPEPRFYFLETIREYALKQLAASGELEEMQRSHATYYLALAERVEPGLYSNKQAIAVSILAREQDNLRAALTWAIERNEAEIAQRLCGALGMFWEARTQFQEAHHWIDSALQMTRETSPAIRAKLLMAASRIALWEIECQRSRELARQALALYEIVDDVVGKTGAIFQIGDTWHMQGEYALATRYFQESLEPQRQQENWRGYAFTLSRLGAMAILQGNFQQAWTWLSEAVILQREYSEPGLLNVTLVYLGVLALIQGDLQQSLNYLREGLLLAQQTGNRYMLGIDLIAFGCLLGTIQGPYFAARVCSGAEAVLESLNTALPAAYRPLYIAYISGIKSQIDETTWETWWAEGKRLSQEEISRIALDANLP